MFTPQLLHRRTQIIVKMSWLEELNPADQPIYEALNTKMAIIEAQLIAAKFTILTTKEKTK
jgi:hypothetical protein